MVVSVHDFLLELFSPDTSVRPLKVKFWVFSKDFTTDLFKHLVKSIEEDVDAKSGHGSVEVEDALNGVALGCRSTVDFLENRH